MSADSADHLSNIEHRTSVTEARFWLAAIADSSDDAIVGKDLGGIVKSWNKAAEMMFGYTFDEIVGQPITCIIPPERIDEEALILSRITQGEKVVRFETERRHKEGRLLPVSITVCPIRNDQNIIIGISKIARDLTERDIRENQLIVSNAELERLARHLSRARDAAESANRAKSRFLANISHELRTPLSGILGYAQLIRIEGGLNTLQSERMENMIRAGSHLLELITSVLDLSEVETGHAEVQAVECDAEAVALTCVELVRPVAIAKGLTLAITVTPGTQLNLVTDPLRLRQILINLLGNAVKFTSRGAIELRLGTSADGSSLRIEITDTGRGISTDQRQRLFMDFERLDITTSIEGAGIGLALSARLTALMGGRIGHKDNPSGGSVFWLELPLSTDAKLSDAIAFAPCGPQAQPTQARALNVLVVDDVIMNRDIAGSFLLLAGHSPTYAESGEEAIALVSKADFDVVLMDLRMPMMDGLEATRRIRSLDGVRGQVPIIAFTAHAFAEQAEECRNAGMDDHVTKPFDQTTLLSAIGRATAPDRTRSERVISPTPARDIAVIREEPLLLNPKRFAEAASCLSSDTVATHLQTLLNDGQALMRGLRNMEGSMRTADEIATAAHRLGGGAGMFGFDRVEVLCLRLARAIRFCAADVPVHYDVVHAAIEAMLQAIHERSMPNSPIWQFERLRGVVQTRVPVSEDGCSGVKQFQCIADVF